jgi:UDP-glucose 4-epimerase
LDLYARFRVLYYASFSYRRRWFSSAGISAEYFQHRAEVRVLDNRRSGRKSNLSGLHCQFMVGSVLDRDLVREAMTGVDFVFHLAAIASVQESMQETE